MNSSSIHARLARAIKIQQDKIFDNVRKQPVPPNKIFRYHGLESRRTCNVLYIGDSTSTSSNLPFSIGMVGPHVSINRRISDDAIRMLIKNSIVCNECNDKELFIMIRLHGDNECYHYKTNTGDIVKILRCVLRRIILEVVVDLRLTKVHVLDNSCFGEPNTLNPETFIDKFIPPRTNWTSSGDSEVEDNFIMWHSIVDKETLNCAEYMYGTHFLSPLGCILQDYIMNSTVVDFLNYMRGNGFLSFEDVMHDYDFLRTDKLFEVVEITDSNKSEQIPVSMMSSDSDLSIIKNDQDELDEKLNRVSDMFNDMTVEVNEFIFPRGTVTLEQENIEVGGITALEGETVRCLCGRHRFPSNIKSVEQ
jgi:hypothetical protein